MPSKRRFADFFAGIGLMRLGLELAGWNIAFANDISEEKFTMYSGNFSDASSHYLVDDVYKIKPSAVPDVELATASFPCTDLSLAGARLGLGGNESSAYWGFVKILREMGERRPPLVLLENVSGFLTSDGGKDFEAALVALNELGYAVDPLIVDAVSFVPQSRERIFVVARRSSGPGDEAREPLAFYESDLRPRALADFVFRHPGIRWDLRDLPRLPHRDQQLADVLEDIPLDESQWWNAERRDYLVWQMSRGHRETLSAMVAGEDWSYGTVFRRVRKGTTMAEMRTDGIAGCLRTPKGGSARQILVKAGRGQVWVRLLTPRECARLMGADDYTIAASMNKALFGFGDAVCVPVVEWIAKNYLNPLIEEMRDLAEPSPCGVGTHDGGERQPNDTS